MSNKTNGRNNESKNNNNINNYSTAKRHIQQKYLFIFLS